MAMRRTIVAGNWKMNGTLAGSVTLAEELGRKLAHRLPHRTLPVLFPPAPFLLAVAPHLRQSGIAMGAQDCSAAVAGSFTGDVAASMLRDVGCSHVIVGHSERRHLHGESNEVVRSKAAAAIAHQLTPVICVGEDEAGLTQDQLEAVLREQVRESVPPDVVAGSFAVAYEPVWAIGAADSASMRHIDLAQSIIYSTLTALLGSFNADATPILYGGSVNSVNCTDIFSVDTVGGVLVGRSSMNADEFVALIAAAEDRRQPAATGGGVVRAE